MKLNVIQCDVCKAQCDPGATDPTEMASSFIATFNGEGWNMDVCAPCKSRLQAAIKSAIAGMPTGSVDLVTMDEMYRRHVLAVIAFHNWNKSATAETLGVERSTLDRRLKGWGINRPD